MGESVAVGRDPPYLVSGKKPRLTLLYHLGLRWDSGTGDYCIRNSALRNLYQFFAFSEFLAESGSLLNGLWQDIVLFWCYHLHLCVLGQIICSFLSWMVGNRLHEFFERHCIQSLGCVWLFATLWTIACQAPLSMGFPGKSTHSQARSGLPFPCPLKGLPVMNIEFTQSWSMMSIFCQNVLVWKTKPYHLPQKKQVSNNNHFSVIKLIRELSDSWVSSFQRQLAGRARNAVLGSSPSRIQGYPQDEQHWWERLK